MRSGKSVSILGIRGIPARHGGFETFAEVLALYLQGNGWDVTVYCQAEGRDQRQESQWQGIRLVTISTRYSGPMGSIVFDFKSTLDALLHPSKVNLTLGYNTAMFSLLYRLFGRCNIFNMDGLEWKRSKWSKPVRVWFYINEWLGCWLGNRLIADHPEIARHLRTRGVGYKLVTIPYGSDLVPAVPESVLSDFGLDSGRFALLVARAEPENSILELVTAFSSRTRGIRLVVLGDYDLIGNSYHRAVQAAASEEVLFLGAVFDKSIVAALRFHSLVYLHGHQVGGTNPSLVEALGAGCAILAHDNCFNRWVAGDSALYFSDLASCGAAIDILLGNPERLEISRQASRKRHAEQFTWPAVLAAYEHLLLQVCGQHTICEAGVVLPEEK